MFKKLGLYSLLDLVDFWPHVFCSYYYECTSDGPVVQFCPNPQFWNQNKKECDDAENVPECEGGTRFVFILSLFAVAFYYSKIFQKGP
jgi:hypothetical protein